MDCCFLLVSYHPCHCRTGLASLQFMLIGSGEVEKAREGGEERDVGRRRRRRREMISLAVIIALMFIAAPSSFALTLWKLVTLKIIKQIR